MSVPVWPWMLAVYVIGFIVTARLYVRFTDDEERDEARFNGTIIGLIWPVAIIIFGAVFGLLALPTIGVKTRQDRQLAAKFAAQERRDLQARIAELERQLEIGEP